MAIYLNLQQKGILKTIMNHLDLLELVNFRAVSKFCNRHFHQIVSQRNEQIEAVYQAAWEKLEKEDAYINEGNRPKRQQLPDFPVRLNRNLDLAIQCSAYSEAIFLLLLGARTIELGKARQRILQNGRYDVQLYYELLKTHIDYISPCEIVGLCCKKRLVIPRRRLRNQSYVETVVNNSYVLELFLRHDFHQRLTDYLPKVEEFITDKRIGLSERQMEFLIGCDTELVPFYLMLYHSRTDLYRTMLQGLEHSISSEKLTELTKLTLG